MRSPTTRRAKQYSTTKAGRRNVSRHLIGSDDVFPCPNNNSNASSSYTISIICTRDARARAPVWVSYSTWTEKVKNARREPREGTLAFAQLTHQHTERKPKSRQPIPSISFALGLTTRYTPITRITRIPHPLHSVPAAGYLSALLPSLGPAIPTRQRKVAVSDIIGAAGES